jgi:hypothetical protein
MNKKKTATAPSDEWRKRWEELEARDEALLPELMEHVCPGPWGPMVEHRLIRDFFYQPGKAGLINDRFLYKQAEAKKFLAEKMWWNYIFLVEKPYRSEALLDCHAAGMRGAEYWKHVGWAWTNNENIHQELRRWKRDIWLRDEPERAAVMSEEDRAALDKMPNQIIVWRGTRYKKSVRGMSWTLDQSKAIWFARRFEARRPKPLLVRGCVAKADVLAYFSDRSESEIVSTRVKIEDVITLPANGQPADNRGAGAHAGVVIAASDRG